MRAVFAGLLTLTLVPFAAAQTPEGKPKSLRPVGENPGAAQQMEMLKKALQLPPGQFLDKLDKNGDKALSRQEVPPLLGQGFDRVDANKDGKLDREEVSKMMQVLRQRVGAGAPATAPKFGGEFLLKKILQDTDTNGDGKIAKSEAKGRIAENFDKLDSNSDGFIDRTEIQRFVQRMQQFGGRPGGAAGPGFGTRPLDFDALDRDADGRLTEAEVRGTPLAASFAQADANNDGRLTREEFDAARVSKE